MARGNGDISSTDSYIDKTSKLIPGEALALFLGLSGIVWTAAGVSDTEKQYFILASAVFVGFVAVPLVLWHYQRIRSVSHYIVSIIGFVLWVLNVQYDRLPKFTERDSVAVLGAAVALIAFTFISPLLVPPKDKK